MGKFYEDLECNKKKKGPDFLTPLLCKEEEKE